MRIKTRVALPLVQIAVAITLKINSRLRPLSAENPSWTAPDRQFCDALNAPAALVRIFLLRLSDAWLPASYQAEFLLETIVYFVLVGLLWYIVSIEIGGKGQSVLTPKTRARRMADGLVIFFGLMLGILGLLVRGQFGVVDTYSNLVAIPYYIWALVIVSFYGHDLWVSFRAPGPSAV